MSELLEMKEARRLATCEKIISTGLKTFAEVGNALLEIRESKLYRETHGSFSAYCKDKWGFAAKRAKQLIEGARVATAMGTNGTPLNERQARELKGVPPRRRKSVLKAAKKAAEQNGRKLSATDIKKFATKSAPPVRRKKLKDEIGREIPKSLHKLWERKRETGDLMRCLNSLKGTLELAEVNNDPLYAGLNMSKLKMRINALHQDLIDCVPYAVCGLCQGLGCKVCSNGFMSRRQWQSPVLPKKTRELLEKGEEK